MIAHCLPTYLLLEVWVQMLETLLWVLAITNKAAVSIFIQVYVWTYVFLFYFLVLFC